MNLSKVEFSGFKDKGQQMFGNTQRRDWEKEYAADENGMCSWALRSLLIEHENNLILIDTGFNNFDKTIIEEYSINDFATASENLINVGIDIEKISHVIHTHLHIDHCGGSFIISGDKIALPTFINAQYFCSKQQLNTATQPSEFEETSFQTEITSAFSKFNNLQQIEKEYFLFPWLEFLLFNGHTKGLTLPVIHSPKYSIAYVGDLIPTIAHLRLQSVMNYDINPLLSLSERENFLEDAFENEYILFFQHDFLFECCTLKKEKGRILPAEIFKLSDL
jgi:glyoxylase-like metal-dependent hydrolase (beta-lactamase superfamily II)